MDQKTFFRKPGRGRAAVSLAALLLGAMPSVAGAVQPESGERVQALRPAASMARAAECREMAYVRRMQGGILTRGQVRRCQPA